MVALEALEVAPKAKTAKTTEKTKETSELSFESFLKGSLKGGISIDKEGMELVGSLNQEESEDLDATKLLELLKNTTQTQEDESKSLLELLKNESSKEETTSELTTLLDPKLSKELSEDDLKYLAYKAKKYLKEKITTHPEFKQLNIEEMPKTLKGLVTIANELKIDISKITYETIENDTKSSQQKNSNDSDDVDPLLDDLLTNKKKIKDQKIALQDQNDLPYDERKFEKPKQFDEKIQNLKDATIFKDPKKTATDSIVTTKQLIDVKTNNNDTKKTKEGKNDLLQSLLSSKGSELRSDSIELFDPKKFVEKASKTLGQNQAIDSLKQQEKENTRSSLENLLKTENTSTQHTANEIKTSDSFEVKLNEAKQMMRYLSQDIKKAIDDYKPPFTRVKVTLNPQKLGEVDLTVVQRGNNVHVNLSSNNAALNILTNNLSELKTQLQQSGINNASFNFNSQGQNEGKQEQRQQKSPYATEYGEQQEEEFSDAISSLDIIIPRYI